MISEKTLALDKWYDVARGWSRDVSRGTCVNEVQQDRKMPRAAVMRDERYEWWCQTVRVRAPRWSNPGTWLSTDTGHWSITDIHPGSLSGLLLQNWWLDLSRSQSYEVWLLRVAVRLDTEPVHLVNDRASVAYWWFMRWTPALRGPNIPGGN